MMDEKTLTRTLHDLAHDAAVPPDPAAGARRRALRIRRRRAAVATGGVLTAVAVVATTAAMLPAPRHDDRPASPGPTPTWSDAPTSEVVTVRSMRSGPYPMRSVVFYHDAMFCAGLTGAVGVGPSQCAGPQGAPLNAPMGYQPLVGEIGADRITRVFVEFGDGSRMRADIVSGRGFRHRAYAATLPAGHHAVAVVGYDRKGRQVSRIKVSSWVPDWPGAVEPASVTVPVWAPGEGLRPPAGRLVYWRDANFCTAVLPARKTTSPPTDWNCHVDVSDDVVPGAVRQISGGGAVTTATVDPGVTRVVLTLHDGRTVTGEPADGYGFVRPILVFAAKGEDVARVDAYDAHGRHLGGTELTSEDLR